MRRPACRTTRRSCCSTPMPSGSRASALAGLLAEALAGRGGPDRLGRTGPDGGGRRPRRRPVLLRPLERAVSARQVTSLTNPTVKAVRALHLRKEREETRPVPRRGPEDRRPRRSSSATPRRSCSTAPRRPTIRCCGARREATAAAGGEVIEVSRDILAKVSRRDNPQTVVGVFEQVFAPLDDAGPGSRALLGGAAERCAIRAISGPSCAPPTRPAAAG